MRNIELWFNKLQIKFLCWLNGEGFKMPRADAKEQCMYNYCKSIINNEEIHKIDAYEKEIERLINRCTCKATREDVAKMYMKALESVYGKENI